MLRETDLLRVDVYKRQLGRLCEIMECQPGDLIEYLRADTSESNKQNCQG